MFCKETQEHIPLGVCLCVSACLIIFKKKRKSEQELICKMLQEMRMQINIRHHAGELDPVCVYVANSDLTGFHVWF